MCAHASLATKDISLACPTKNAARVSLFKQGFAQGGDAGSPHKIESYKMALGLNASNVLWGLKQPSLMPRVPSQDPFPSRPYALKPPFSSAIQI